jgi:hypothetical protein
VRDALQRVPDTGVIRVQAESMRGHSHRMTPNSCTAFLVSLMSDASSLKMAGDEDSMIHSFILHERYPI